MAASWERRVDFLVKYLYDVDQNGLIDEYDFECMALRACILECKGVYNPSRYVECQHIMRSLWEEMSEIADFDKDGQITLDEFKKAVQMTCMGRRFEDFPQAMKAFIESNFKMIDMDGDGIIDAHEFRFNCISRLAIDDVRYIDEAFEYMLTEDDKRRGGLTLTRYKELYSQYLGNTDETLPGVYLFGPLIE